MCGIAGFLDRADNKSAKDIEAVALTMARAISHRGPDGYGAYAEPDCGLGIGHRRLSIVDLSDAGSQPMLSRDGRLVIGFNGEIYNYVEMRAMLEQDIGAFPWRGHCDTEVLLEAIAKWGIDKTLRRANGMFAFCVWDRVARTLYLARDRIGEKPLYYGWQSGVFLFGSEMKALAAYPDFNRKIDRTALSEYLVYGYVPTPLSIFEGIRKLPPGCWTSIGPGDTGENLVEPQQYWAIPKPDPTPRDDAESADELDSVLRESVRLRMRADVPMGAFLSGGIDSSTVVSLMQSQSATKIRTFSIGFREFTFNESHHAKRVARHLGTDHTEMFVTERDALDVVPKLPTLYDEPFADSSQVPTYLLAKLTRGSVKVALSGDAGDEIFAGYARYFSFQTLWRNVSLLPFPVRAILSSVLKNCPDRLWRSVSNISPTSLFRELTPQRAQKLSIAIKSRNEQEFYKYLVSQWSDGALMQPTGGSPDIFFNRYDIKRDFAHPILGMSFVDMGSYLVDDILVKVDRATMSVGLEGRVPFLDPRVLEFAARLPLAQKIRGGTGKWLLRRVLEQYVPEALVDRPKMGFGIPVADWLRGALKDWSHDLLFGAPTVISDLINMDAVRKMWLAHQTGEINEHYRLWTVLMLIAWGREWQPT